MREVGLARVLAVDVDPLRDIRRDTDDDLHNRVLEDQKPLPPVPGQAILGRLSLPLLRHLQSAEEELPLAVVGTDELEEQQEEVAQRKCLHDVGPWCQVEVGRWNGLPDELDDGDHGDEHADSEDLELLVRLGKMCRVSEHQEGDGEECESSGTSRDDGSELMECVAASHRFSRRFCQWIWQRACVVAR